MKLSIIEKTLTDGSRVYDLQLGEQTIETDAVSFPDIMGYAEKFEDALRFCQCPYSFNPDSSIKVRG